MDKFKKGDKVYIISHNIYFWIFRIFKPCVCGKIIRKHWRKKYDYWWGKEGVCDWYWVNCVGYIYPILVPETCIQDLTESIQKDKRMFESMGEPDLFDRQRGAYEGLKDKQLDKELYLSNN